MDNKLFAVAEKIDEIQRVLDRAKAIVFTKGAEYMVPAMVDLVTEASEMLDETALGLEDYQMSKVDFDGINLDKAFEGNPVSDYVTALVDYNLGDEKAADRIYEALDRITEVNKEDEAILILQDVTDREHEIAMEVSKDLERIERVLEGTEIDKWSHAQTELARYFLSTQPDNDFRSVELLTPHGVGLAWKRRRYLGAAK